jgi:long-chain acyl-CoA synthetase
MFLARVDLTPDAVAYYYPVEGGWQQSTWAQAAELVDGLAAGFVALGVTTEDRVAIVSSTRYEWILIAVAAWSAGAAVTTVRPGAADDHLAHVVRDSGARVVVAEDYDQVHTLWRIRAQIRDVTKVVQIDGDYPDDRVLTLEGLLQLGHDHLAGQPRAVARRRYAVRREGLAAILYTSGTDGAPRGVRLRHSALTYQGAAIASLGMLGENDLLLLALPLAHSFGQSLLAAQLACGFPAALDDRPGHLLETLGVVRPTFLGVTPRMLTEVRARVAGDRDGRLQRRAADRALEAARRVRDLEHGGQRVPAGLARRLRSLDRRHLAAVREAWGGRLRFVVSGGAALDRELAEYFELSGVVVLDGYGLTEAGGAVAVDLPGDHLVGSVGRALPGTQLRIGVDGEVQVAGPGVMDGYHGRRVDTAAVMNGPWLSTGDSGVLDGDGRLRILGRHGSTPRERRAGPGGHAPTGA